ncbi:MAG: hypothetical protein WCR74_17865 [Betaproteobacteria bacterium]
MKYPQSLASAKSRVVAVLARVIAALARVKRAAQPAISPVMAVLFRTPALALNFAAPQSRSHATGLAAVAAGAVLLALALWQSDLARERVASLDAELVSLGVDREAERNRSSQPAARGGDLDERVRKANRVIRQLSTPWHDVFGAIATANGEHSALLSLESDPATAQVRAGAEARNAQEMLEYLERLRIDGRLAPAILQSHQVIVEDPSRPIRFTFSASWTSAKSAPN